MTKIANMNSFKVMLLTILQIAFYLSDAAVPNDRSLLERNMLHSNELNLAKACISRQSFADYYKDRKQFIDDEIDQSFGMDTKLNEMEKLANNIIMNAKEAEYQTGFLHPYLFNPSRHIFEVLGAIKQSKLFQIIQRMPKGGILHAHDMALCSTDFVVSLTYWPHLWQRTTTDNNKIREFKFSHQQPSIEQWQSINNTTDDRDKMIWRLVSDVRAEIGSSKYDDYVRTLFTLFNKNVNPKIQFRDINDVWNRFLNIFKYIGPIVTYAPAWKEYYKHAMKEMLNDGVQYLEFRGILPPLYDMDGNNYDEEAAMRIYVEALDEFKRGNPTFIGSKFIYAPMKAAKTETINGYFKIVRHLYEKFPEFLAGFDLVGQEDTSPSLLAFAENILELPSEISLFFHAGETNWFGSVDENLVDAVLLGTKRIGHGFSLLKHPKIIELVKANDIAVEVNPVSNQVLRLVDDYRNHPASAFLAHNIPIVISSDDPSFWEVTPLSHDFYMAFLGVASRHADLRVLKKFAMNSIQYSSLNDVEKEAAFAKWQIKWDSFIDQLVHESS